MSELDSGFSHLSVGGLEVFARDDQSEDPPVEVQSWCQVALDALASQGVSAGRVDLFFVDRSEMAALNLQHLGNDGPTDVLSFPMDTPQDDASRDDVPAAKALAPNSLEPPIHLGDIVICPAVARAQAQRHMGSEAGEFALLTIHGVLHILGHDHAEPDETRVMQHHERELLKKLQFVHPVRS